MAINLHPTEVHLWHLQAGDTAHRCLSREIESIVSLEELDFSRRFLTQRAQETYLVARSFVRVVLSHYVDLSPKSLRFSANAHGKPELSPSSAAPQLRFNLSKADGLFACVVACDRDVGVDAELVIGDVDIREITDRYFAPVEIAALAALPDNEQRLRFFALWTLKEAYLKACGKGFSVPLDRLAFTFDRQDEVEITFNPGLVGNPGDWYFRLLQPANSYLTAVALNRRPAEKHKDWHTAIELIVKPFEYHACEDALRRVAR